jgi:ribosomal-protein-alanine N-acetyltransferase
MTESLALVLREAFITLRLHRVEANIQPANTASIALVRRLGFELEGMSPRYLKIGGRWRDHERYALRVETWRARRG